MYESHRDEPKKQWTYIQKKLRDHQEKSVELNSENKIINVCNSVM